MACGDSPPPAHRRFQQLPEQASYEAAFQRLLRDLKARQSDVEGA
jgi:hypothetical protein